MLSRSIERMRGKNQQVGEPGNGRHPSNPLDDELRGWIDRVGESKPNPVRETKDLLFASATPDGAAPIRTTTQSQRIEQMYQLAEIFASIFETVPDGYEDAIATTLEEA